ncbi:hypothetical protein PICMEDRAFT_91503 [Pichia membranifaciens NRRL Y-2026]|uniref:Uncharacterized protein n=1 Tax=Pichia membranifaciens NRRL Y-2026 TaxID=763406 RepID=A0A1E3NTS4_9ASCO|nr:hypothetical protein PICMEDRAFT_91503 [Pichia membranifaciens NRRL Y-2026]ODQ49078.1 hypothetical protein PICMEDRAFT_91503 [Pichia membranifaciens NRRL Y-2026]
MSSLHHLARHNAEPAAGAPAPAPRSRKHTVLANFKSISRRKKLLPQTQQYAAPSPRGPDHTQHPPPLSRRPSTASAAAAAIPSTETFNNLAQLSNNPALRTRNPARKRHSVIIHSVTEEESRKNSDPHNPLYVGHSSRHARSTSSLDDLNLGDDGANNRPSLSNGDDLDADSDLDDDDDDDDLDIVHVSQDSDTILRDLDPGTGLDGSHSSKNYSNTLNNAFSNYPSQISAIPASASVPASLSSRASLTSSISTANSPSSSSRQKYHPLRKLVINSPNNPSSSTFSKNTITPVSTASISTANSSKTQVPPSSSPSPSPSPSPYRRLDPNSIQNRANFIHQQHKNSTTAASIPSLHIFQPDLSDEKPHIVPVSNCLFFETLKPQSLSPAKPSQTLAADVFDDFDTSPTKKKSFPFQRIHYSHQNTLLSTFAKGLVDPDLFSTNASSVFSGPKALPSKHRTSLYFV